MQRVNDAVAAVNQALDELGRVVNEIEMESDRVEFYVSQKELMDIVWNLMGRSIWGRSEVGVPFIKEDAGWLADGVMTAIRDLRRRAQ